MALRTGKYSHSELKSIAHALKTIHRQSDKILGASMNTYHTKRFYNETHYIDFHETLGHKVYKKYKGWKPVKETFNK